MYAKLHGIREKKNGLTSSDVEGTDGQANQQLQKLL